MVELRLPRRWSTTLTERVRPVHFTSSAIRALLVVLAFVSSLLAGVVAGVLSYANGTRVPGAVLSGGGAFVTWMTLSLVIMGSLGWLDAGSAPGPHQNASG